MTDNSNEVEEAASAHLIKMSHLQGNQLFRDFQIEQIERFHETIRMRTCREGHVFYRPGETGEVIFLLKQGSAQLYRLSPDGRKFVFARVPPGSVFGEMSCIGQGMYDCFAEAAEDSLICTMSRSDVIRLIIEHPVFAIRLLEAVGSRMVQAERQLEDLVFKGLIPRLATLLLDEQRDGVVEGLSHQDLAERLGVYRETATYALNELKSAGIVQIARRHIRILDPQGLLRSAQRAHADARSA